MCNELTQFGIVSCGEILLLLTLELHKRRRIYRASERLSASQKYLPLVVAMFELSDEQSDYLLHGVGNIYARGTVWTPINVLSSFSLSSNNSGSELSSRRPVKWLNQAGNGCSSLTLPTRNSHTAKSQHVRLSIYGHIKDILLLFGGYVSTGDISRRKSIEESLLLTKESSNMKQSIRY